MDIDGNGKVDIQEFIAAVIDHKQLHQESFLSKAFNLFDIDGDGQITKKELQRVLGGAL
eukprot:CAMPEP_0202966692 /NCGR_PEP_ID=MMETSP1396-20130829/11239_1 /ASSEMBLY_ACC=CAM_ASM_000872 /TAXON_ID= /ORGANISM="Pseudokeronopsis sp., Strain Brazil" /LENGTH=58 /DNA_ID=CAMNT_0049690885 /DNA_START=1730 /DNA_END=1906 /DNA_ORIENTATION=-